MRELGSIIAAFAGWLVLWVGYNDVLVKTAVLPPYVLEPLKAPALVLLCAGALLSVFVAACAAVRLADGRSYTIGAALAVMPSSFVYLQYEFSMPYWTLRLLLAAMVLASIVGCRLQWNGRPALVWITAEDIGD